MTQKELDALARALQPVVKDLIQRSVVAAVTPLEVRILELETRPAVVGPQGERGLPGERGEQGERGEPGMNGTNGRDGKDGAPGLNGKDGSPGERGERGEKGDAADPALLTGLTDRIGNLEQKTILTHRVEGDVSALTRRVEALEKTEDELSQSEMVALFTDTISASLGPDWPSA